MKNIIPIIIMLSLLFTTACRKHTERGEGRVVTEKRSLATFEEVQADGDIDVVVIPSNVNEAVVSGYENLVPIFETSVQGGTLRLKYKNDKYNIRNNNIKVIVYTTGISSFTINGSGKAIIQEGLDVSDMNLEVNGSGDIVVEDNYFNTMRFKINGSGHIKSQPAICDVAYAKISGSGNIELTVTDMLDVKISGSGEVDYWGDPETVNTDISGSGKVRKH